MICKDPVSIDEVDEPIVFSVTKTLHNRPTSLANCVQKQQIPTRTVLSLGDMKLVDALKGANPLVEWLFFDLCSEGGLGLEFATLFNPDAQKRLY
ncbi:hypothetical protein CEXT_294201 [Caerostris extrusa]|uniref:Uncharacterized protein n=1 Tax=Caerostris extrusa TaxID=172846 RepID=A0AAV4S7T8_CAEEX|nr:hypothetical protein CEXT_294201 [Caerostris extrusa]